MSRSTTYHLFESAKANTIRLRRRPNNKTTLGHRLVLPCVSLIRVDWRQSTAHWLAFWSQIPTRDDNHGLSSAVQSQKAVSAYFTSNQILPFGFAVHTSCMCHPGVVWERGTSRGRSGVVFLFLLSGLKGATHPPLVWKIGSIKTMVICILRITECAFMWWWWGGG